MISNIIADLPHDSKRETRQLSFFEKKRLEEIFNQPFTYLGKGCQAYVFASKDGQYVVKFFKFQRFRPQWWLNAFSFIPPVQALKERKIEEKKEKLEKVFNSWKIAFESLQNETGVVYVHMNKSNEWKKKISIRDKLGLAHQVDLDQVEFLVQRRAKMLCPSIDQLIVEGREQEAEILIDRLLIMLLWEYGRGYADNDHALMQNTGVLDGFPIHIDVGQFIYNPGVKVPKVYKQEIYDKTYKFHHWLKQHYPSLSVHLETRLVAIIGPDYFYQAPYVHKGDVAKITHIREFP